ncbi:GNAT family N-acetyltransferase [Mycoplasmatota bacterium WC44]
MEYRRSNNKEILGIYKQYYKDINGGIDGYYEKTILDADIYEVYDQSTLAYFSVHYSRGLTSLVVLPEYKSIYNSIFSFVMTLPLFTNILFTENDKEFLKHIKKHNIQYEIQAYNFEVNKKIVSSIKMKRTTKNDIDRIKKEFGEFIEYNEMQIEIIDSFFYTLNNELISFGALEPLLLNENRYCVSMIVNEAYRGKGYGSETVKYLVEYLQSNNLECNARCYVLNEVSRKTLIKSGLDICGKLYKV